MDDSRLQALVTFVTAILLTVSLVFAADGNAKSTTSRIAPDKILEEIEIPRDASDLITVPITLKNGAHRFILNMANPTTIYDLSLRDQLGKPLGKLDMTGVEGGTVSVDYFAPPAAKIWDLDINMKTAVICADLKRIRRYQRLPIYGVLGMDFLRNHVIRLDFDRGKLTFLSKAPADSGTKVAIQFTPGQLLPTIPVTLPRNQETQCLLGTTLYVTMLFHPERFDALVKARNLHPFSRKREAHSAFGTYYDKTGVLDGFHVGAFKYRRVGVIGGNFEGKHDAVGLQFFARHIVTLDFPNKVMYLKKGAGFGRLDYDNVSGLKWALDTKADQLFVDKVTASGPAKAAGIMPGDIIMQINGKVARDHSIYRLRYLLSTPRTLKMTIKRGDKQLSVSMKLRVPSAK